MKDGVTGAAAALLGLLVGPILALYGFGAGAVVPGPAVAARTGIAHPALEAFHAAFAQIKSHFVEEPDDAKLVNWAIHGLLRELDPHSALLDAQSFRDLQQEARGIFGGLGIAVTEADGLVKVVAPAVGSHAARAGIRPGDIITHIDGVSIRGLPIKRVVEKMRGPVNSRILLKLRRPGVEQPLEYRIARDLIRVRSVWARTEGNDVGYIRIGKFNALTFAGLRTAINELKLKVPNNKLKGYVLDLRNNPGGLFDQAIRVASLFVRDGEIVSTRGRNSSHVYRPTANEAPRELVGDKPVVVLINGGTASAAEIVAGALKDHRRATLIGSRSFGKGSVQTTSSLGPGNGALKLTTAWYFTPSGRSIQASGIIPDIEVSPAAPKPAPAEHDGHPADDLAADPAGETEDNALELALALLRETKANMAFPPNGSLRN